MPPPSVIELSGKGGGFGVGIARGLHGQNNAQREFLNLVMHIKRSKTSVDD
jgi:hypothetical protein